MPPKDRDVALLFIVFLLKLRIFISRRALY